MQTRIQNVVEVLAGTAIGFVVAMLGQVFIMWQYGIQTSLAQDFGVTVFFTGLSILRGYAVRSFFNWWWHRGR